MQIHTEYRFIPSDHILYTFYDRLSDIRERKRERGKQRGKTKPKTNSSDRRIGVRMGGV